jgi:hypothetical protein
LIFLLPAPARAWGGTAAFRQQVGYFLISKKQPTYLVGYFFVDGKYPTRFAAAEGMNSGAAAISIIHS